MFLNVKRNESAEGMHHISAYSLSLIFGVVLSLIMLSGCENFDVKEAHSKQESSLIAVSSDITKKAKTTALDEVHEPLTFAPTVEQKRTGSWLGGAPPINKRASGINTFYRIKSAGKPNHLVMTLRFEGVEYDDARVEYRTLDGAKFKIKNPKTQWRLKANTASEVTFTLVIPDGISYLALDTFQNNQGASRAFILKVPEK